MKRIFPILIAAAAALPVQAQWPAERHPLYDAAAPTAATEQAPASQLKLSPTGEKRITASGSTIPALAADGLALELLNGLQLQAWRGERCSAQLEVYSDGPAEQLTATCTVLSNGNSSIPANVSMVRFTKAHGEPTADIIGHEDTCNHPGGPRALWLQVDVPRNATPGIYEGVVTLSSANGGIARQPVVLRVAPETLPAPSQWKIHLDLWQYPYSVARWHDVEPWSPEHFALLRPLMKRLADAGQKCITCTLLDEAWNAQTYDWFPSMIRWIRGKDGVMRYDYSTLDKWIHFMHDEIGIREQINCYTMIPWHLRVRVFDEATGRYENIPAIPGEPSFEELWGPFLRDFHQHMQQKGWAGKTSIAIDERPDKYVREAMRLVQLHAPEFRIASAVDKPTELTRVVHSIAPVITHAGTTMGELLQQRRKEGKITLFYVCLHPLKPNTFTHSPMAEAEWLGLFAAANHLDGFLRWAYNAWNRNPLESTDFGSWPSGDCFLVYPGNHSSIRFERLRDGIENYEKINLLRARAGESPEAAEAISRMNELLEAIFTVERSTGNTHADDVQRARRIIDETAAKLRQQP